MFKFFKDSEDIELFKGVEDDAVACMDKQRKTASDLFLAAMSLQGHFLG